MGAGKSTLGPELAARLGRPFVSIDALVEERTGTSVADLYATRGEAAFRELEAAAVSDALARRPLAVVELGGGALGTEATRTSVRGNAFALLLETTLEQAWERVAGSGRPLADDVERFRALYEERRPLYEEVLDGRARDVEGAVLTAAGVRLERDLTRDGADLIPACSSLELVVDATVASLHGDRARTALADRLTAIHEVAAGEAAKTVAEAGRLWSALRLDRGGALVGLGGGSTLDLAGFVAATYLRGIAWVAVPTTLVAQVDAAIGGKTALDLPEGKNLVGAFHWPARVLVDPALLETLPELELRNGVAEVVKTGLLAGEPFWELELDEQIRRCAAFKAAVCLRDPFELGERAQLNLGHTFAHALEAASGYALSHGRAVGLGLLAALRLSGLEDEARTIEQELALEPARVAADTAWEALKRDKKASGETVLLVLLEAPGKPRWGVELPPAEVRSALESVID